MKTHHIQVGSHTQKKAGVLSGITSHFFRLLGGLHVFSGRYFNRSTISITLPFRTAVTITDFGSIGRIVLLTESFPENGEEGHSLTSLDKIPMKMVAYDPA